MQGWGRCEIMRETDRQIGREGGNGETRRKVYTEETEVERRERWVPGWVGGCLGGCLGGCTVTGGVQKREGHSYIVIDTQVGGTHEDPGLTHNLVKVSQVIYQVLNKQNNCHFTVTYKNTKHTQEGMWVAGKQYNTTLLSQIWKFNQMNAIGLLYKRQQ